MKMPALLFTTLLVPLLAACSNNNINPYTGQPLDGSAPARLATSAEYPQDRMSFVVKAINDRPILVKSDIRVPAGSYRITLRIVQGVNMSSNGGINTTSWKEGEIELKADLQAGHRYRPAGTLEGTVVKNPRLEDLGPVVTK